MDALVILANGLRHPGGSRDLLTGYAIPTAPQ